MTDDVVTKSGSYLLNEKDLVAFCKSVEKLIAGWWWSLSQTVNGISFSAGPGNSCPNLIDNGLLLTEQGDSGLHLYTTYNGSLERDQLSTFFNYIKDNVENLRAEYVKAGGKEHPPVNNHFRQQSDSQWRELEIFYQHFISLVPRIEMLYTIRDIYLGSCDLSVDCSIRGLRDDGSEFDVSVDLMDADASIGESLEWSVKELLNDTNTPREKELES